MTRELRRLSIVMLAMFLALFASLSWIQVVQAEELAQHPDNNRTLYDSYEIQRGAILVDGTAIAASVRSPDVYSFQRTYTDPMVWAPVTGYFNPALRSATGIERAFNAELSGTGSSAFFAQIERILSGQPQRGANVMLTLDSVAQLAAYEALTQSGYQGAVIAMEPATGRILAMASTPSFDTNLIASHSVDDALTAFDGLEADPAQPLANRAIAGDLNPPGSTFKIVVAAAAYESGEFTPQSTLPNLASYVLPGTSTAIQNAGGVTCGSGGATVTIADAVRYSCNIPLAQLAVALGDEKIFEMAEKLGFNRSFETPLESTPSVYPRALSDDRTALSGFGQGDVRATPLQMAMVSAAIANGGVVMNPHMVEAVLGNDLSIQRAYENTEFGRAMSAQTANDVRDAMVASVRDGAAQGARIDGIDVAGKTGTAQNGDTQPFTLWFTGFAPADNPQVAVAVVIEDGGGMGQSATGDELASPIAKRVIEAVLNR